MSSPGFTGGGGGSSDYFTGRSITTTGNPINNLTTTTNNINNNNVNLNLNNHHLHHPSLYRTQPPLFLDPSSQIPHHNRLTHSLIGKRTLAEFQTQQNQTFNNINNNNVNLNLNNNNNVLSNLLLRSVKPRTNFHHTSSPLSFSVNELQNNNNPMVYQTQRLGVPLLHQLRPQQQQNFNFQYRPSNSGQLLNPVQFTEPEKNIMDHRLQELEKQLLEDNDEGEDADAASVITTSEWSETYQNLIGSGSGSGSGGGSGSGSGSGGGSGSGSGSVYPNQKPASSSPTSSTTSSTSSCAASPASVCSKQTLIEAASAIAEGKNDVALEILNRLMVTVTPNPTGNSDQRLTDCMVSALKSRMNPMENPPPVAELFSKEHSESTQLLLDNSVCFKVGFMAANLAILEAAFEDNNNGNGIGNGFCLVDFEIGQGKQYVNLLHALTTRKIPLPVGYTVKIAAVAENGGEERLKAVGEMLNRQAEKLRIAFEFRVVSLTQKLAELTRESLGINAEETVMVNFAFKLNRIPDESVSTENPRDELLRRVKKLSPRVVTIVEQEMNCNTAPFLARVAETWSYYGALFDSVESVLGRENSERVRIEEGLSRKLCNSVACEGRDRVERCEVFGKWRARMSMAGFVLKPMSQNVCESIKSRLALGNNNNNNNNRVNSGVNSGINVKEENGGICFGWMGRTLTVASAWR